MARHIFHLSDYPKLVVRYRVDRRQDPSDDDCEVYAPCCGRRTIACAVADVRHIPNTIVRGGGFMAAKDHGWLCDGCRARLFIEAKPVRVLKDGSTIAWTESGLLEARGAPAQMVHWHQADEWRMEMIVQHGRRGEEYNPDELHEVAMGHIVDIHRKRSEAEAALEAQKHHA